MADKIRSIDQQTSISGSFEISNTRPNTERKYNVTDDTLITFASVPQDNWKGVFLNPNGYQVSFDTDLISENVNGFESDGRYELTSDGTSLSPSRSYEWTTFELGDKITNTPASILDLLGPDATDSFFIGYESAEPAIIWKYEFSSGSWSQTSMNFLGGLGDFWIEEGLIGGPSQETMGKGFIYDVNTENLVLDFTSPSGRQVYGMYFIEERNELHVMYQNSGNSATIIRVFDWDGSSFTENRTFETQLPGYNVLPSQTATGITFYEYVSSRNLIAVGFVGPDQVYLLDPYDFEIKFSTSAYNNSLGASCLFVDDSEGYIYIWDNGSNNIKQIDVDSFTETTIPGTSLSARFDSNNILGNAVYDEGLKTAHIPFDRSIAVFDADEGTIEYALGTEDTGNGASQNCTAIKSQNRNRTFVPHFDEDVTSTSWNENHSSIEYPNGIEKKIRADINYILEEIDENVKIVGTHSSNILTIEIPLNSTKQLPVGFSTEIEMRGGGESISVVLEDSSNMTLESEGQYIFNRGDSAKLIKTVENTWVLTGKVYTFSSGTYERKIV